MALKQVILLFAVVGISNCTRFTLCGRELPISDPDNGAPDAYVQIFYAPKKDAALELIGETYVNANNQNPDWAPIYSVPDSGDASQYLKFKILDADDPDVGDELIGEVSVTLKRVHEQSDRVLWTDIRKEGSWKGQLVVKVQKEEGGGGAGDCSDITCPPDVNDQYFPHPSTCNAYCQCSNGTPYERPCPTGLVFNPELSVCVHADTYDCPHDLKIVKY